jgi:hypothetical protein
VEPTRVTPLIVKLDSERFLEREQAKKELELLEESAEVALRQALERKPSLEVRRRIEHQLKALALSRLRAARAVEILEQIGTAEARQVLLSVAKGDPKALRTREAKASLQRLSKQPGRMP